MVDAVNHGSKQRFRNLVLRGIGQLRGINEEGFAVAMRHGAHDAVPPWVTHGLEDDLKKPKLARLQLRQGADDADERIEFAALERIHELAGQAKFHYEGIISFAAIPCLLQCPSSQTKHPFGEVSLQLPANQRCVIMMRGELCGDTPRHPQKLEGHWLAAARQVREEMPERFKGDIEISWKGSLEFNQRIANEGIAERFLAALPNTPPPVP